MANGGRNQKRIARRGLMLVLSSPSGAGKTTLSRMLLKADRHVELSVSVTTRPQRRGEVDGRDYHFIDLHRFQAMVKSGKLLEWAEVFGHCYGTPRRPVEKALQAGRDVLFDIDWQGTQQLSEKARDDSGQRLHSAADGEGTRAPAQATRAGQSRHHRLAHGQGGG